MTENPDYLIAARERWDRVSHDPEATPAEVLAAEDDLRNAQADAKTEGY